MKNILVPIDGSDASLRALKTALEMTQQQNITYTLHVLNVQAPVISNNAARFFSAAVLQSYYQDEGQIALNKAKEVLNDSNSNYEMHIEVGQIAEVVKNYVTQKNCDHIVMGTRGLGAVPGLLLGSAATKILSSVEVPVTLIK